MVNGETVNGGRAFGTVNRYTVTAHTRSVSGRHVLMRFLMSSRPR